MGQGEGDGWDGGWGGRWGGGRGGGQWRCKWVRAKGVPVAVEVTVAADLKVTVRFFRDKH